MFIPAIRLIACSVPNAYGAEGAIRKLRLLAQMGQDVSHQCQVGGEKNDIEPHLEICFLILIAQYYTQGLICNTFSGKLRDKKLGDFMFKLVALLVAVCLCCGNAFADQCATGKDGKKVCAPPGGGALVNDLGVVVVGAGDCAKDKLGKVKCSDTLGGDALVDGLGEVKVGKGKCVLDGLGMVMCSDFPKGQATLDKMGLAVCDGGCVVGR